MIKVSDDKSWAQLLGSIPFSQHRKSYSVRIEKTQYRNALIGVADSRLKNSPIYLKTPDAIWYHGYNGSVWGDGKRELWKGGRRLKTGNIVTINLDLNTGEVKWIIDEEPQFRYSMEKLKDNEIYWVPFLALHDQGDIVEWL